MKPNLEKRSLYSFTINDLRDHFQENGLSKFVANQIYDWIYKKHVHNLDEWTNVSKKVKSYISENLDTRLPRIVWNGLSVDGTRKFLVAMTDDKTVEAVAIPAKNNRLTLCLSSQVGCAIGCTFCHTGTMGLTRHLDSSEIVGQFLAVQNFLNTESKGEKLTNIVYMGQGEPLHNFENVKVATQIFTDDHGLMLGQRKITLSTSGLVPQIEKLHEFPPVNIAISLHAAHNNIRSELMPINKAYDLDRLLEAIKKIPLKAHRWITYEYLLISEYNDRKEDVDALEKLLDAKVSKINLIPFNEYPDSDFKRPSENRIKWFQNELMKKGYITTVRTTKGSDILAACGQLKSEMEDKINLWD
ncbi:23S rRNA (adenine(2503)-C(2))-methyltransferase RlmN [Halobacteriovorax sp. GB3]|uniref:23S rRNA (adenine(2503)-C(2))-methyltransferase RlmN n=1 Tax=Halobacteriovorax sp. GB3 TaxID=2719615 RepID=UPI00235FFC18|nr:23S rRNA (adenine(2503)-C(2))-methyltransferase RlmN [Halobacteriovorax sp. GB3]MDD0853900.1 23S rRNA (adenine(2503)-C(2))-methyltransferase RlmN [Halobacteriovorax sp. GB3]